LPFSFRSAAPGGHDPTRQASNRSTIQMPEGSSNRLSGIELLRFAAALTVLIAHYQHFYFYGYAQENFAVEGQPLFRFLWPFYRYGTRAVEVFWCLSGFIFFFKYAEVIGARKMPGRRFFWLRFSRLYPLHFITLIAVCPLQWAYFRYHGAFYVVEFNDLRHFVLNLLFAQYWGLQDGFSFNGPSWSVSVEVLAYLFFFVVTYLFRADFFVALACVAACVAADRYIGAEPVALRCIFYFYLGGLSCLAYRAIGAWKGVPAGWVMVGAGLPLLAWAIFEFLLSGNIDWILNLWVPVALALLAAVSGSLSGRIAGVFDSLGNLTYASYMIHFPIQLAFMLLAGILGIGHGFAGSPYFLLGFLLLVLGVSGPVYKWIELPLQYAIRSRLLGSRPRP
jgi:peptidoglycan/LPS O-acetylase OafA/YrhL